MVAATHLKQPNQPVIVDGSGVLCFKPNLIVKMMLDGGRFDLKAIKALPNILDEDRNQFLQLIGFSLAECAEAGYIATDDIAQEPVEAKDAKNPSQPVVRRKKGGPHYRPNLIVQFLVWSTPFNPNAIAQLWLLGRVSGDDYRQLDQLHGMSVSFVEGREYDARKRG